MNGTVTVVALLFACFIASTIAGTCCPDNEEYSECGNNACQNTCQSPNIGIVCKAGCKSGCICIEGYLRNTQGDCVPAVECDTCKENEIFDLTRNNACVNTCAEPNKQSTCEAPPLAGCVCQEGYVRNDQSECIPVEKCEQGCGGDPNAVFRECGNNCPTTCDNKDSGPRICAAVCRLGGGCDCKPGFVLDHLGKCIPPEDCPNCGKNALFKCGPACDTECATLGEDCPIINKKCTFKCFCQEGFARNAKGNCIPESECPPRQCKDDPNAIISPNGDPCPVTCENKDNPPKVCTKLGLRNGCKCKKGFVRNTKDGKCILPKNCPKPPPKLNCKKNEQVVACPSPCAPEKTCESYFSGIVPLCPIRIDDENCKPACQCKPGFVRINGACVEPKKCCTDPNSELVSGPNPCGGGTCAQPEFGMCKRKSQAYGCQCKKGYLKISDTNNKCILKKECKKGSEESEESEEGKCDE